MEIKINEMLKFSTENNFVEIWDINSGGEITLTYEEMDSIVETYLKEKGWLIIRQNS